jgi:hypothetical protein
MFSSAVAYPFDEDKTVNSFDTWLNMSASVGSILFSSEGVSCWGRTKSCMNKTAFYHC